MVIFKQKTRADTEISGSFKATKKSIVDLVRKNNPRVEDLSGIKEKKTRKNKTTKRDKSSEKSGRDIDAKEAAKQTQKVLSGIKTRTAISHLKNEPAETRDTQNDDPVAELVRNNPSQHPGNEGVSRFKDPLLHKKFELIPVKSKKARFGRCYFARQRSSGEVVLIISIKHKFMEEQHRQGYSIEEHVQNIIKNVSPTGGSDGLMEKIVCGGSTCFVVNFDIGNLKEHGSRTTSNVGGNRRTEEVDNISLDTEPNETRIGGCWWLCRPSIPGDESPAGLRKIGRRGARRRKAMDLERSTTSDFKSIHSATAKSNEAERSMTVDCDESTVEPPSENELFASILIGRSGTGILSSTSDESERDGEGCSFGSFSYETYDRDLESLLSFDTHYSLPAQKDRFSFFDMLFTPNIGTISLKYDDNSDDDLPEFDDSGTI